MVYRTCRNAAFVALLIVSQIAAGAFAASSDDAQHFADTVGSKVLKVLNAADSSEAQKQKQLRQVFSDNVDINWMGQFALGRSWQQLTSDQRDHYLHAYNQFMLRHYTTRFQSYSGSKYTITRVQDEGSGRFSVYMRINSPNAPDQQEIDAGYRLQVDDQGHFKITDIIVDGVSQITTQRSEFYSVIQRDGVDALIRDLENKA